MNTIISLDHNDMQKLLAGEEVEIQMNQALVESNHVFVKPAPDALVGIEKAPERSFATFKDGHTEEIFYFERYFADSVLFATASGVYVHRKAFPTPGVLGLLPSSEFFRVHVPLGKRELEGVYTIESITLDERVKVHFILGDEEGDVLVAADATDEQIKVAILDTILDFSYEKVEE